MDAETYSNIILKPDFSHLVQHISPDNMLEEWGGTLHFSIDEYIQWRAEEEGVSNLLTDAIRRSDCTIDYCHM